MLEQRASGTGLIRPRARYTGPDPFDQTAKAKAEAA
jgi:citrate synthase